LLESSPDSPFACGMQRRAAFRPLESKQPPEFGIAPHVCVLIKRGSRAKYLPFTRKIPPSPYLSALLPYDPMKR
jgi:hypothetical protein